MWLFIIATLLAMFVKGLVGFGNTLVFDTITSYTANNVDISPVELLLTYPSNLFREFPSSLQTCFRRKSRLHDALSPVTARGTIGTGCELNSSKESIFPVSTRGTIGTGS